VSLVMGARTVLLDILLCVVCACVQRRVEDHGQGAVSYLGCGWKWTG